MKLEAKEIIKKYDECILDKISLEIKKSEILAITGPSGCGKSTLLSILGLLMPPTAGEVLYNGVKTSNMSDRQRAAIRSREFGFIFQNTQLLNSLTVLENVLLPADLARIRGKEKPAKELLAELGLKDRLSYYPYQMSIGQRRRASIARALIMEPKLIFADEPTNDLDEERTRWVEDYLLSLPQKGYSVVIVSHDMGFVGRIPNRYKLENKKLIGYCPLVH